MRRMKCASVCSCILAFGLLATANSGLAAPLPLVKNGRSSYAIYHAEGAPGSVQRAAAELRDYLQQATGSLLPVVTAPREPMVSLGDNPAARAAGLSAAGIPLEGFRVVTQGPNLYIVGPDTADGERTPGGGTSAGTRNGVYALLERFLGVRWLMPGEHGDYVPKAATVTIPDTDWSDAPFFVNRRLPYIQERRPETIRWGERQRLGYSLYLIHSHNWTAIEPEAFDKHPDWFAERGGVRIPPAGRYKLCTTNDGLIRAFADAAIAHFDKNPGATCYSLSPADSGGWCECARCRALYEKDPNGSLSVTPAILTFYNRVAKLVAAKHPRKTLAGYVYAAYVFPPATPIRLEPNLFLVWAPSFDYGYTLYRPGLQQQWDRLVAQWGQVTENVSYYDLPTSVANASGAPNPPGLKILKWLYPRLKQAKMKGVYVYGNSAWGYSGVMNYILAKLAWDPDADVDALFSEYCEKAYGAGAAEMKALYRLLDAETERHFLANASASYTLTPERMRDVYARNFAEMERLYRAALAKTDEPEARTRLEMFGANLTVLHWNLRQTKMLEQPTASGFYLADAGFFAFLKRHEGSLALAAGEDTRKPAVVGQKLRVAPAGAVLGGEKITPFLLRGDQRAVILPVGNAPVQVSFSSITARGTLPRYAVYGADGAEVSRGLVSAEVPITLEKGNAPYYHLVLSAGPASFRMDVAGAAWALEDGVDDQGLHFLGKVTPLYFEVPAGVASFHLWLAATPPGETAAATLYAPGGRAAATFDCTQVAIDRKQIEVRPGEAGFWKLVIREAPTGAIDDVYVKLGPELPGYLSLSAEGALRVAR